MCFVSFRHAWAYDCSFQTFNFVNEDIWPAVDQRRTTVCLVDALCTMIHCWAFIELRQQSDLLFVCFRHLCIDEIICRKFDRSPVQRTEYVLYDIRYAQFSQLLNYPKLFVECL